MVVVEEEAKETRVETAVLVVAQAAVVPHSLEVQLHQDKVMMAVMEQQEMVTPQVAVVLEQSEQTVQDQWSQVMEVQV